MLSQDRYFRLIDTCKKCLSEILYKHSSGTVTLALPQWSFNRELFITSTACLTIEIIIIYCHFWTVIHVSSTKSYIQVKFIIVKPQWSCVWVLWYYQCAYILSIKAITFAGILQLVLALCEKCEKLCVQGNAWQYSIYYNSICDRILENQPFRRAWNN